jgi:hypothetical protein
MAKLIFYDPYINPVEFCGVAESLVQAHYQSQLSSFYALFLFGGLIAGLIFGAIILLYYLDKKGRLLR